MSVGVNDDVPTVCPICGTPYDFGSTGVRVSDAQRDAGPGATTGPAPDVVDEAVAYCPNPDCPSHAGDRVDDPGGA